MTATPDIAPQCSASSELAVGRGLFLLGLAATFAFGAMVAGVCYAWVLLHQSSYNLDWPFSGWQVVVTKVLIGVAIVAIAIAAGYASARLRRSLSGRSRRVHDVVVAAVIPGIVIGGLIMAPINVALATASDHTSAAQALRAQLLQTMNPNAPLQVLSPFPAAPPAIASRLLTPAKLGAGWYDVQRPASRVAQIPPSLASQGALQGGGTTLTLAQRGATGWILKLVVTEDITTFATAAQARHYTATFRQRQTQACDCSPPDETVVVADVARSSVDGVAVETWLDTIGASTNRSATFSRGVDAFTLLAGGNTSNVAPKGEFMMVVRRAVASRQ